MAGKLLRISGGHGFLTHLYCFRFTNISIPASTIRSTACLCIPQSTATGNAESRIFDNQVISCTMKESQATINTRCENCDLENNLRVFESYLQGTDEDSGIWFKTRRLVMSYGLNNLRTSGCYSFWLPITDIWYEICDTKVILEWSDCNQLCEKRSGDSDLIFDYKYQPHKPNNKIIVQFSDTATAQNFVTVIISANLPSRLPWKRIVVLGSQELCAFEVPKHRIPKHYVVQILTRNGSREESKLFIHRPNASLDIWIDWPYPGAECVLSVKFCGRVSTPNYISNITGKPSSEKGTVAECSEAELVFGEYKLELPLIQTIYSVQLPEGKLCIAYSIRIKLTIRRFERHLVLLNRMERSLLCCYSQGYGIETMGS
jgi:hypothetical protein